jgi:hypothetical protein
MLDKTEQSEWAPNSNDKPESCYCSALPKGSGAYPAIRDGLSVSARKLVLNMSPESEIGIRLNSRSANALFLFRRATAVTTRAEQYRWVAHDCRLMAESLPAGQNRCALLEMAEVWERLADQQAQATDLTKNRSGCAGLLSGLLGGIHRIGVLCF